MLQQTQVKTVIPYWERWMRELPTLAAAAQASPEQLHKLWEGLGYYTRVRNLQQAARQILARHHGSFPQTHADVLALPGIGPYTAGAICSIAYNQPTPILDGNVIRVLTRVFGIAKNPKEKATNERLWQLAAKLVQHASRIPQPNSCSRLNQSLMELGALVCTPRKAQCQACPLQPLCVAYRDQRVASLPCLVRREPPTARRFVAFVITRRGRYLLRQRSHDVVNALLWEFPNVEVVAGRRPLRPEEIYERTFGEPAPGLTPLTTFKHSITRYRITLEAYQTAVTGDELTLCGVWRTPVQLRKLAFTSAHRKILNRLNLNSEVD